MGWAPLLATNDDPPPLRLAGPHTLADVATATADFRDEYYALDGAVADDATGLRVITVGGIDLAGSSWGTRPIRLHGRTFKTPRVNPSQLPDTPRIRRWYASRAVPKVLVATQTRVIEAMLDAAGDCLGSTPVLSVFATKLPIAVVAALIASPVASAWAHTRFRGSALNLDVIKLSASQLLTLPLPADLRPLDEAADACLRAHTATGKERERWLRALAEATTRAWGADRAVIDWWWRRIPVTRP